MDFFFRTIHNYTMSCNYKVLSLEVIQCVFFFIIIHMVHNQQWQTGWSIFIASAVFIHEYKAN